jgi:GGDEF domain-containing protein
MAERSATIMHTLLGLHREQDPQGLLRFLLSQTAPDFGRAVACCYLLDRASGEYRLEMMNDAAGEVTRRLWRADLRAPLSLPAEFAEPALRQLAATGDPVLVSEGMPGMLTELWGTELTTAIQQLLECRFAITAPICTVEGPVGVLVLMAIDAWPIDAAAECTAHAAAALANMVGRRGARTGNERDPETGLHARDLVEQAGRREINRADRYRRALSLAVIQAEEHDISDPQFRELASHVTRVMRQPDTAGRMAPRQIIVLLPETPTGGAAAFIRRLHELAGATTPRLNGRAATFPQDGRTWEELVAKAVERLSRPEIPAVPGASIRGGLRAAMPNFSGGNPQRSLSRWG